MPTHTKSPSCSISLFDDRVLADPHPTYAALRAMGPAVYLEHHGVWAVPGYAEVRTVLNDLTFSSDGGGALTSQADTRVLSRSVLSSDGEEPARLRHALARHVSERSLARLGADFSSRADQLVAEHTASGSFDAVALARQMVSNTVLSLMGLPESAQATLVQSTFDVFGPVNASLRQALTAAVAMHTAVHGPADRDTVAPDSLTGALYAAVDQSKLPQPEAIRLACDYICASVDTTVFGLAEAILRLAQDSTQWARLRQDPTRAEAALHEALRVDAPIQGRGRIVTRTTDLGGVRLEAGQHLWLLYGSTGRDEREWGETADTYDLGRPFADQHLAFGLGSDQCTGMPLALALASALLRALAARGTHLTLAGDPVRAVTHALRGYSSVPVAVELSPHTSQPTPTGSPVRRSR
ncbi:cytochrome P450 [Streptomyces sp. NPDC047525]|uniref:cytochrome P450 n=1 Tax=Streptomyces sp. NPDC047525 TaxID=3155264 RepID=UPI0033D59CE0